MATLKMQQIGEKFYTVFWHPILKRSVRCSLGGASTASHNLDRLQWLRNRPEHWQSPPADLPLCVLDAWHADIASRLLTPPSPDEDRLMFMNEALKDQVKQLVQHNLRLERELSELRGQRYDIPDISVEDAAKAWIEEYAKKQRDPDWKKIIAFMINRFAAAFKVNLPALVGRELQIKSWIEGLGISTGAQKQYRDNILRFLADSGLSLDRDLIVIKVDPRREPIDYLTREEAQTVVEELTQPWKDAFRLQVGLGLRPSELCTLKKGDLKDGVLTLRRGAGDLTLKTGTRSIRVPDTTLPVLTRRLAKGYAFPMRAGRKDCKGKPYTSANVFARYYREALKRVPGMPFKLDARTGRRTCGSLMLRSGRTIEEVAAYLGSDPETIRAHYARILSNEVDGSAAAI